MTELTLPRLSMTMEEATVTEWLVDDGAEVVAGQPVVEVETDKAQNEITAPVDGVLHITVRAGDQVLVDGTLGHIVPPGSDPEPAQPPDLASAEREGTVVADQPTATATAPQESSGEVRQVVSPAARRVAREHGVDLTAVTGSGPRGRVTVADVEDLISSASASPSTSAESQGDTISPVRRAIAANIVASWQAIPHIHISGELGCDGLAQARRIAAQRAGVKVTATDLLLLAMAQALTDVPALNGTVGHDGAPSHSRTIDISLAVAAPGGVVAPTLKGVGELELAGIAEARARLVEAARAGTLSPRDLGGGTSTLSNLGAYPVDFFAPVISGPQIATVATGRARQQPVAIDGVVGVGYRMIVNVAIDHRGADGEAGGRFLAAFERRIADLPSHLTNLEEDR
jgi:pyruvate dehydrogenase E2 component (dihydrolipoamide acetyltransferase)